MLGGEPAPGDVRLCLERLRIKLESLPFFVALATLRLTGNAWPTSRRMVVGRCCAGLVAKKSAAATSDTT